ncbi:MAG: rhodanese-like domain-containing protein [Deltaproteobacteria bacterium]|nr:rhodanese-like domain-containing protein [Deltaproteobacteria bacterium]
MRIWFHSWRQGIWIFLIAMLLGLGFNELRSDGVALFADWSTEARLAEDPGEFTLVSLEEARMLCSMKNAVFVDARTSEAYRQGHILCAQNLPWESMEEHMDRITAGIPLEETIIVYCDGEDCMLSEYVARELFYRGYDNIKVLVNGWTKWLEAGLPIGPESVDDTTISG